MIKEEFLFASGLDFNHLYVLQNIDSLPEVNRLTGYYNMLKSRGFIEEDGIISTKGQEILELFCNKEQKVLGNININQESVDNIQQKETQPLTFSEWCSILHTRLQEKLFNLTGKKQVTLSFDGKLTSYPYLCGVIDLEGKLKKFLNRYKGYDDLKRIEALLLKHCEIRNQKIMRYILREKPETGSDMASDYENYVEEKPKEIIKRNDFFGA